MLYIVHNSYYERQKDHCNVTGAFFVCCFLVFSFVKNWLGGHLENSEKTICWKREGTTSRGKSEGMKEWLQSRVEPEWIDPEKYGA